jgi:NAD-dependent deacetylase
MTDPVARLAELLRAARRIFVFTGAGLSTASNIPDYRGPNGVWRKRAPVYYDDFLRDAAARREFWDFKLESWIAFRDARPNPAHDAIVALERRGVLGCLTTQNTDGLHARAGTSRERLIELHGTNLEVECVRCERRSEPEPALTAFAASREAPTCADCGGFLKAAVIMFGQALRSADLARAQRESRSADLVLSLGSSLVVTPAADVPLFGARAGAPYAIVNRGETPHDRLATLRIDDDVGRVLPAAVAAI